MDAHNRSTSPVKRLLLFAAHVSANSITVVPSTNDPWETNERDER